MITFSLLRIVSNSHFLAEVREVIFPFSSHFHVFLRLEKISENAEMDGLALPMGQR